MKNTKSKGHKDGCHCKMCREKEIPERFRVNSFDEAYETSGRSQYSGMPLDGWTPSQSSVLDSREVER